MPSNCFNKCVTLHPILLSDIHFLACCISANCFLVSLILKSVYLKQKKIPLTKINKYRIYTIYNSEFQMLLTH